MEVLIDHIYQLSLEIAHLKAEKEARSKRDTEIEEELSHDVGTDTDGLCVMCKNAVNTEVYRQRKRTRIARARDINQSE